MLYFAFRILLFHQTYYKFIFLLINIIYHLDCVKYEKNSQGTWAIHEVAPSISN